METTGQVDFQKEQAILQAISPDGIKRQLRTRYHWHGMSNRPTTKDVVPDLHFDKTQITKI